MALKNEKLQILMVCLGNICRSPLAEGIMRQQLQLSGIPAMVDSAGTAGYHIDEPPHNMSQRVASAHGIQLGHLRARQLTKEDFIRFDLIFFMDDSNLRDGKQIAGKNWDADTCLLLLGSDKHGNSLNVPDPYWGGYNGFEEVFDMIWKASDRIVKNLINFERTMD